MSTTKPARHNPDNLTPEQYGASDGWRLLYVGENITSDAQWSDRWQPGGWSPALSIGQCVEKTDGVAWRTRTPDPYAEKPADAWIKMSERKPTEADLPVWAYFPDGEINYWHSQIYALGGPTSASHWKPAKLDVPAPTLGELTQAEKDSNAADVWSDGQRDDTNHGQEGFVAGIAYERAEIAKLLFRYYETADPEALDLIRARVKGGAS